jgi:hypothetical protein
MNTHRFQSTYSKSVGTDGRATLVDLPVRQCKDFFGFIDIGQFEIKCGSEPSGTLYQLPVMRRYAFAEKQAILQPCSCVAA